MTIPTNLAKSNAEPSLDKTYPPGSTRFDWIVVALSVWVIAGYFLIGWASFHGKPDSTSPMSWATVAYAGVLTLLVFLLATVWRSRAKGYDWRRVLPQG